MADEEPHILIVDCMAGTEWRQPITGEDLDDHKRVAEEFDKNFRQPQQDSADAAAEIQRMAKENPDQPLPAGLVARALRNMG